MELINILDLDLLVHMCIDISSEDAVFIERRLFCSMWTNINLKHVTTMDYIYRVCKPKEMSIHVRYGRISTLEY